MSNNTVSSETPNIREFIQQSPKSKYILDDKRGVICRVNPDTTKNHLQRTQECIQVKLKQKEMFNVMQDLGYICGLDVDPTNTYLICKGI
ncbi:hypothetical protein K502DRAFT_301768, partial [Neoconidiobolus thromboides FSU 785]